jgi:hypothetical protein
MPSRVFAPCCAGLGRLFGQIYWPLCLTPRVRRFRKELAAKLSARKPNSAQAV